MNIRHALLDIAMSSEPRQSPSIHATSTPSRKTSVPKRVQHKLFFANPTVRYSVEMRLIDRIRHDVSYSRLLRRKNPSACLFSRFFPTLLKYITQPWSHGNDPGRCLCLCTGHYQDGSLDIDPSDVFPL